jgi:O-antigen/teichoic acid export membrane protein
MNISRLFASNILWRGGYLFTSLIVTVLLSRYLGAYKTGWMFYFISWLTFFFLMLSFSLESAVTYFVASGTISELKIRSVVIVWTLIVTAVTVLAGSMIFTNDNEFLSYNMMVALTVSFISGNMLVTFFNALFYAQQEYRLPNLVFIFFNTILIALLLMGINGANITFAGLNFIEIYFLFFLLQGLVTAVMYHYKGKFLFSFSFLRSSEIKKIFLYSGAAFTTNILFFLVTRIDYWLIDYYRNDNSELGNYIQASRLVQLFQMLPTILAATIFPVAAAGHSERIKEIILRLGRIIIAFYALVMLIPVLTGKWLFPFIFGETFIKMYEVFLLLIPGLFALSLLALMSAYFAAVNRLRVNFNGSLAGLIVIGTGNFLFIPKYGIEAAALVSSLGYITCFVVAFMSFKREVKMSMRDIFLLKKEDISFLKMLFSQLVARNPI